MSVVLSPTLLTSIQQELNHVEKLEFETGLDSEGEPANWIWVVINAKAPKKAWSWESREHIRSVVRDKLKEADVTDWAYVRFRGADEEAPSKTISST